MPTIYVRHIPERRVAGMPLGRHVRHDTRSRRYPVAAADVSALTTVDHQRHIPILDQGNLGSCTGNAAIGCIGTGDFLASVPDGNADKPGQDADLDEKIAVAIYSAATALDDYDGQWPPTDTGSDGLSVAKACVKAGLISGYTHALSSEAALTALSKTPVIAGVNWYDTFDEPDADGLIKIGRRAQVRGGHELVLSKLDVERKLVRLDNSWTADWGVNGSAFLSWSDLDRLLKEQGDVTAFTPLTSPAPTPVPDPDDPDAGLLAELEALIRQARAEGEQIWSTIEGWLNAHGLRI